MASEEIKDMIMDFIHQNTQDISNERLTDIYNDIISDLEIEIEAMN